MEHNPSYDICNIDTNFQALKQMKRNKAMSVCMQYLDSNDTIKMDINPSYGVHTVES